MIWPNLWPPQLRRWETESKASCRRYEKGIKEPNTNLSKDQKPSLLEAGISRLLRNKTLKG